MLLWGGSSSRKCGFCELDPESGLSHTTHMPDNSTKLQPANSFCRLMFSCKSNGKFVAQTCYFRSGLGRWSVHLFWNFISFHIPSTDTFCEILAVVVLFQFSAVLNILIACVFRLTCSELLTNRNLIETKRFGHWHSKICWNFCLYCTSFTYLFVQFSLKTILFVEMSIVKQLISLEQQDKVESKINTTKTEGTLQKFRNQ